MYTSRKKTMTRTCTQMNKPKVFGFSLGCGVLLTWVLCLASGQVYAQQASSQASSQLILLGTAGGPLPRAHRAQTAQALVVNGQAYIIDAGDGLNRRIVQAGLNFTKINQVFITHLHNDHMAGLGTFLYTTWSYSRRTPLDVYGPIGTVASVQGAIHYFSVDAEIRKESEGKNVLLKDVFVGHDLSEGLVYQDANVKVSAIQNDHYHFPPEFAKRHQSFSYRFDTKEKCYIFSGDTGPSHNLEALAKGCDVMVSEVGKVEEVIALQEKNGTWKMKTPEEQQSWARHMTEEHMTPRQVGELAQRAGIKVLIMSHLLPTVDPLDDYARFKDEASQYFKGEITVGKDLMRF
jgi:ribonuclease BN (tRNA processing enzyme)